MLEILGAGSDFTQSYVDLSSVTPLNTGLLKDYKVNDLSNFVW